MAIHILIPVSMSFSSSIGMDMFGLTVPSLQVLIIFSLVANVEMSIPTFHTFLC